MVDCLILNNTSKQDNFCMNFYGTSLALLARNNGCIMDFLTEEYIHSSPGDPKADWKNNTDQTYSCLRDWLLSAQWGKSRGLPETPQYDSAVMVQGVSGAPMMSTNYRLSV